MTGAIAQYESWLHDFGDEDTYVSKEEFERLLDGGIDNNEAGMWCIVEEI